MGLRSILLLVVFIASIPVCFIRPFYGILLWIVVAFMNPQEYIWNNQFFPWAMAVAIPTLLGAVCFARGWRHLASREFFLLLLLWTWFTITSLVSANTPLFVHHAIDTWYRWRFVSKIIIMALLAVPVVTTPHRLRILLITIAGCFGFFVLKALPFMILTGGKYRLYGPANTMIGDNNDFGLALNMTLPFFFFLASAEFNPWLKRLFGFLFVITIPAIFFTYSRGSLVGFTVVMVLMLLTLKRRIVLVPILILSALIALLFAPEAWKTRMDLTSPEVMDSSARSRINSWTYSWHLAMESPIAGGGFDTFTPELFARYAPTASDIHGPHSIYFQVLAEHGFVGLFLYLALVASCFHSVRNVLREARLRGDPVAANYANLLRFSLVAFLVTGTFLGRAYFDYFFTIVACIVILKKLCVVGAAETGRTRFEAGEQAA
jgi:putative inorganic carbon (HCO3(-)) transporter